MQMDYEFDATQYTPNQGGGTIHPVGLFPFLISKTEIVGNQAGTGGIFKVHYKTPEGEIVDNFNLWHENPVTVRIAHEQLSALGYAVGIFKVSMRDEGAALLNAQGMIEVVKQGGDNPKGYTQVAKRLNSAGQEVGPNGPQGAPRQGSGPGNGGGGFQPPAGQQPGPANNGGGQGPGGFQPPQGNGQQGGNGPSWGNNGGGNAPQQQGNGGQQPPAGQGGWQQGGNGGGNAGGPSWGNR